MIVVELKFTDDPRRLRARPAHRSLLERLHRDGRLVMAGPWENDSGALLVFDTDDEELEVILASDPYYSTPGVEVARRRRWSPLPLT